MSRLNRTCPRKEDTFILDFVNTKEDILQAFRPFYQETYLQQEVNVNLIYQTQKELRNYGIYTHEDIEAYANEYFGYGKQDMNSVANSYEWWFFGFIVCAIIQGEFRGIAGIIQSVFWTVIAYFIVNKRNRKIKETEE